MSLFLSTKHMKGVRRMGATTIRTTAVNHLHDRVGQQVYYDGMSREDLLKGKIAEVVKDGATGLTSNPAIFKGSFMAPGTNGNKPAYDEQLKLLKTQFPAMTPAEMFEKCAVQDIQQICDAFRSVYDRSKSTEGFVSLEVSPLLAGNHDATKTEARRLWQAVNRPNLFIKIPSTDIAVLRELTAEGIQINVTLLFTVADTLAAAKEITAGLQDRLNARKEIASMQSVLSHFVSRIDVVANKILDARVTQGDAVAGSLRQEIGVHNSYRAHYELELLKARPGYQNLKKNFPRLLLASTGCKEDRYEPDSYVSKLALPGTINTMPTSTYEKVMGMGKKYSAATYDIKKVIDLLQFFEEYGNLEEICVDLKKDGVVLFANAYREILDIIQQKLNSF